MFHRVPIFAEYHKKRSAKALPSARWLVLGEILFAERLYAECPLPSATLGKGFAEFFWAFAECLRHSAKLSISVVMEGKKEEGQKLSCTHF